MRKCSSNFSVLDNSDIIIMGGIKKPRSIPLAKFGKEKVYKYVNRINLSIFYKLFFRINETIFEKQKNSYQTSNLRLKKKWL